MIRKVVIVGLMLAAGGALIADFYSTRLRHAPGYVGFGRHWQFWPDEPTSYIILTGHGSLSFYRQVLTTAQPNGTARDYDLPFGLRLILTSFAETSSNRGTVWTTHSLHVSYRLLVVVFAAYPTIAFIRGPLRRWRRRRKGLCLKCGYDLTGNVSGICPECGMAVER